MDAPAGVVSLSTAHIISSLCYNSPRTESDDHNYQWLADCSYIHYMTRLDYSQSSIERRDVTPPPADTRLLYRGALIPLKPVTLTPVSYTHLTLPTNREV